ncbi:metal ABC transporter ATP-binding protein [Candidatus Saccharibacteria bacterium]|nr:metal ABC transporter ATP-binding protein [Candidatus Saccharibacteria bacterium]
MGLITVKNLELGYGGKAVLKDLNFEIDEQDFICVVGPNGAGKTTLVRGILGLIAPMEGEINFEGVRRNHIGYISQENMINPNFPASVFEVVLSGSLNEPRNFYDSTIKKHAEEKLKLLKIGDLKDSSFAELSGGQRQKVLLARALMATKKLLILDEPSNNLDQESKESLYDFIKVLNIKQKIAIIMITHDLDHGNLIGNKILSLRDKDYFFGTTEDFVRKVHHE